MKNAKNELIRVLTNKPKVKCAKITKDKKWNVDDVVDEYFLKVGHSAEEYENFLNSLDFEYDSGYCGQELFGTLWFEDGAWLDRGEYDGREWWQYQKCPDIPDEII